MLSRLLLSPFGGIWGPPGPGSSGRSRTTRTASWPEGSQPRASIRGDSLSVVPIWTACLMGSPAAPAIRAPRGLLQDGYPCQPAPTRLWQGCAVASRLAFRKCVHLCQLRPPMKQMPGTLKQPLLRAGLSLHTPWSRWLVPGPERPVDSPSAPRQSTFLHVCLPAGYVPLCRFGQKSGRRVSPGARSYDLA